MQLINQVCQSIAKAKNLKQCTTAIDCRNMLIDCKGQNFEFHNYIQSIARRLQSIACWIIFKKNSKSKIPCMHQNLFSTNVIKTFKKYFNKVCNEFFKMHDKLNLALLEIGCNFFYEEKLKKYMWEFLGFEENWWDLVRKIMVPVLRRWVGKR